MLPETGGSGGSGGSGGVPARVFAGLRVLELGHYVAAPLVGQLLADQGADVLKVEPPGGDPYRRAPGRFVAWNRGKRSAVLDLRTAEGRDAVLALGPHRRRRRRELPARRPRPPGRGPRRAPRREPAARDLFDHRLRPERPAA